MYLYTIGFTQKSAAEFFSLLTENDVAVLVDVRLNNSSQLAGFSKGRDLEYFLRTICGCRYVYAPELAPAKEIFDAYKGKKISWPEFADRFRALILERGALDAFPAAHGGAERVCLLCSEPTPEHCHRRLLAEMLREKQPEIIINHL